MYLCCIDLSRYLSNECPSIRIFRLSVLNISGLVSRNNDRTSLQQSLLSRDRIVEFCDRELFGVWVSEEVSAFDTIVVYYILFLFYPQNGDDGPMILKTRRRFPNRVSEKTAGKDVLRGVQSRILE